MIYKKQLHTFIPVQVEVQRHQIEHWGELVRYKDKDNKIPVGYVDLKDTPNGCEVLYIKNLNPDIYSGFGRIADQLEVEHCLQRGIKKPDIISEAVIGTLMQHFKRGKRFIDESINIYLKSVLDSLQKGEFFSTNALGKQPMYMPQSLIEEYIEKIKKNPLLIIKK